METQSERTEFDAATELVDPSRTIVSFNARPTRGTTSSLSVAQQSISVLAIHSRI